MQGSGATSNAAVRLGYAIAWKMFGGYGFVQEQHTGRQFFCTRHDILGAFQLVPGTPIQFRIQPGSEAATQRHSVDSLRLSRLLIEQGMDIDDVSVLTPHFPVATDITDGEGQTFPKERQGVILRAPETDRRQMGLLCEIRPHSLTTTTHSAADVLPLHDETKLFSFGFAHSKRLEIGELVRFWSTVGLPTPAGVRRKDVQTAKDIVRLDLGLLTPPEQEWMRSTQQQLQAPQTRKAMENFVKQQRHALVAAEAGLLRPLQSVSQAQETLSTPKVAAVANGDPVLGVVQHFQGLYGRVEVLDADGIPRSAFFHADVVWKDGELVGRSAFHEQHVGRLVDSIVGRRVRCHYDQVRVGKHKGTLRCTHVFL